MSTIQTTFAERRRSTRISPKGSIVLFAGERVEQGRIANISIGGLLAITEDVSALPLSSEVGVELRFDTAGSEWLRLTGRVLRIDGCAIAVALDAHSEPFVRLMRDVSSASGEFQRVRPVVLIDATPERRGLMADAFRACGCAVLAVSTPLEAIVRLGESQFEPELIAIAESSPSSVSADLQSFIEREHPHATLVTIGDDILAPPASAHWLSSSNSYGDLLARIREFLSS